MTRDPHDDIRFELSSMMLQVQRRWSVYLNRQFDVLGLSGARCMTLVEIAKSETALNQRELAAKLGIESPTLVNLLDGLAERDLIRRVSDPTDRRVKRIEITAAGTEITDKIAIIADKVRRELFVEVSEPEIHATISVCKRIQAQLSRLMGPEADS